MHARAKWILFWVLYSFCGAAAVGLLVPGVLYFTGTDLTVGFTDAQCFSLSGGDPVIYKFNCGKYCTKDKLCCDLPVSVSPTNGGAKTFNAVLHRRACVGIDPIAGINPCTTLVNAITAMDPMHNSSEFSCKYNADKLGQVPGATFCPSAFPGDIGGSCDIVSTYLEWPVMLAKEADLQAFKSAAIAMTVLGSIFGALFIVLTGFWSARVHQYGCNYVCFGIKRFEGELGPSPPVAGYGVPTKSLGEPELDYVVVPPLASDSR